MDRLELTELARILRIWGGEDDCVELSEDVQDLYWIELGYDSLSLLQATGSIERKYDVLLDGELLELADTPRSFLRCVNQVLRGRATAAV
ncbi:phosphopantetheine-binding protein [Streptomyces lavendulae]|uniref:Oxytetracycline polyketide synthase acyl carrier protein n=2 Tax=Streptomycetaceae TaxID=2062 RepID=A0A2K8PT03_STRLA|nr:phosphopantetheine-binding protein [Streptomyces lavendulae]GLX40680.1 actinorhodin polyketide synthase acyl carrier protein [Streptomyces roseochromogenus]ADM72851.2 putative acyl carrier protein [Streptomyces lavendulae subsp. lavendulae]ATZ29819.1 Oxytetracycline polyketide synthase acyl carrier protein [Streptomyces lavendulae subsp. lavendulae]GLV87912.1 actinorhodin polyketide synthase acyl carrier protein [Streptomyces lavendulae subsp. lavendulae]GLW01093.1 actinorhodin polyketide s